MKSEVGEITEEEDPSRAGGDIQAQPDGIGPKPVEAGDVVKPDVEQDAEVTDPEVAAPEVSDVDVLAALVADSPSVPAAALLEEGPPREGDVRETLSIGGKSDLVAGL